ncbi:MAG TPA: hypothetical protein VFU82_03610 [Gammaproteobacteria bacterium]|nr:hypothetical protein [Gammaproteobacteria bacterium]
MPAKSHENHAPFITQALSSSEKTFEFIALSLGTLIHYGEENRKNIAKAFVSHSAKAYFNLTFVKNKERNKKIKNSFKKTLVSSLTKNFDFNKALEIISNYCHLETFERKMDKYLRPESIFNSPSAVLTSRVTCLFSELKAFNKPDNLSDKITHDYLIRALATQYNRKLPETSKFGFALAATLLLITIAFIQHILSLFNKAEKNNYPLLMTLIILELVFIVQTTRWTASKIYHSILDNEDKKCKQFEENFIRELPSLIVEIPRKNKETSYHIPLFTSPQLFSLPETVKTTAIHHDIETRKPREKIKTRGEKPTHLSTEKEIKNNSDELRVGDITYHRIYNHQGIATQDFIGINSSKVSLDEQQLKAFNDLIESPKIVAKKGKSGIVASEKHGKTSNVGIFKIKDKGQDVRLHTHNHPTSFNFNHQEVTLHTAEFVTKHASKKNR